MNLNDTHDDRPVLISYIFIRAPALARLGPAPIEYTHDDTLNVTASTAHLRNIIVCSLRWNDFYTFVFSSQRLLR